MANLGPFSNSFWSVPVELQFYLVFPFLMLLLRRQGPKQVALFALAATVLRSLVLLTQGDLAYTVSYTIMGRIDEFLAGMLASYYAATRRPMRPAWLVVILPLATASLWFYNQHDGWSSNAAWKVLWPTVQGLIWASFIVCYLPLSRRLPELISRFLAALGEVSYSTYLLHFVLVAAVASRLTPAMATGPHGAMRLTMLLSCLFVLPASIILARLTFAAIEQPFLSLRVRYVTPLDVQPSVDQRVESEE
jgi:peptidoglycan/LPS O-acetylase OafA/YrhL